MTHPAAVEAALPPADLDRRFYAFVVDRLIAWGLVGVVGFLAWRTWIDDDEVLTGVAVIVAALLVVSLVFSAVVGLTGLSPGKALLGLRVVRLRDGRPVGVGHAVIRTALLGVLTLPTAGIGLAALAMTAVLDPSGRRRGGHDRMSGAVVVDVRPQAEQDADDELPRQIVNLTALRLAPVGAAPAPAPAAAAAPAPASSPTSAAAAAPAAPPVSTPAVPPPAQPAARPPVSPPPAPAAAPPAPPPRTPAPAASSRATTPPRPAADATRARTSEAAAPPTSRWHVAFDTGENFEVAGLALVGRGPEPRPGEAVRHLVPLRSSDMSVSKTHAQFQVVPDGALVVMDRGSTNGTVLVRQGVAKALTPGRPATLLDGDTVRFGDRSMQVRRLG